VVSANCCVPFCQVLHGVSSAVPPLSLTPSPTARSLPSPGCSFCMQYTKLRHSTGSCPRLRLAGLCSCSLEARRPHPRGLQVPRDRRGQGSSQLAGHCMLTSSRLLRMSPSMERTSWVGTTPMGKKRHHQLSWMHWPLKHFSMGLLGTDLTPLPHFQL
jgi:hypothetical protein